MRHNVRGKCIYIKEMWPVRGKCIQYTYRYNTCGIMSEVSTYTYTICGIMSEVSAYTYTICGIMLEVSARAGHSLFISRFALRSPLISFPWIAIALALIWPIFRFAHRSIALRKTSGSLSEKCAKTQIAPKTTAVRSYVCIVYTYICT